MPKRENQFETEMNPLSLKLEKYILTLPGVWKDYAWGGVLFKTSKGKMICCMGGNEKRISISTKLTKEEQAAVVDHEKTLIAGHVGHHGWITYVLTDAEDLEQAEAFICRSFELVAPKKDLKVWREDG